MISGLTYLSPLGTTYLQIMKEGLEVEALKRKNYVTEFFLNLCSFVITFSIKQDFAVKILVIKREMTQASNCCSTGDFYIYTESSFSKLCYKSETISQQLLAYGEGLMCQQRVLGKHRLRLLRYRKMIM